MFKNCRERAKREEEVLLLAEELRTRDENIRVPLVRGLTRLKTYRGRGRGVGTVVGRITGQERDPRRQNVGMNSKNT